MIVTGVKGRRSAESRGGLKAGGGVQGRDGASDRNHVLMGGSREDDDNTKEVFGVPRVMVEEQRNALGMLTQALAQVVERMA